MLELDKNLEKQENKEVSLNNSNDTQNKSTKTIQTSTSTPQTFDLTHLKDLIMNYFKKSPSGLILSNSANKWEFLYGMFKVHEEVAIDQAMRQLIAEEQIIEIKNGVWKTYTKQEIS